jgi:hypothetical protein
MHIIEQRVSLLGLYWLTHGIIQTSGGFRKPFWYLKHHKTVLSTRHHENWRLKESFHTQHGRGRPVSPNGGKPTLASADVMYSPSLVFNNKLLPHLYLLIHYFLRVNHPVHCCRITGVQTLLLCRSNLRPYRCSWNCITSDATREK